MLKYSTGNIVNDTVMTVHGAKWVLNISGDHFVKYLITYLLAVHLKLTQNNIECKQ